MSKHGGELTLAFTLGESLERRQVFQKWPDHITVVPPTLGANIRKLGSELGRLSERVRPITVRLGEHALFGANQTIPVERIEHNEALQEFHEQALTLVHDAGGNMGDIVDTTGYKYRPHVTNRDGKEFDPEYTLDELVLVRHLGCGYQSVEKVFTLDGY